MTSLRVPDMLGAISHLESGMHPDRAEVSQAASSWFASFNMMSSSKWEETLKEDYSLAGAMSYCLGKKERLRVAVDWLYIIFTYDDLLDDATSKLAFDERGATEASKIMLSVLIDPDNFKPIPSLPIATVFHHFWIRYCANSPPSIQKRFVDAVLSYAKAANKQSGIRGRDERPTLKEYIALRRETGAVKTCYPLVEYTLQIEVPDKALHHPVIESLHEAANDIIVWGNDMCSFNREQAAGDYQNLIAIVSVEKDIPVQVSMEYAFLMYQSAVDQWTEGRSKIPQFDPETDEIVSTYIRGVERLISGLMGWSFANERYFGPEFRQIKDTMTVKVIPREAQPLKYAVF